LQRLPHISKYGIYRTEENTREFNLCSGKSETEVRLIIENCDRCIVLLKLTTDRHEASRGLCATAELLELFCHVILSARVTCYTVCLLACRPVDLRTGLAWRAWNGEQYLLNCSGVTSPGLSWRKGRKTSRCCCWPTLNVMCNDCRRQSIVHISYLGN